MAKPLEILNTIVLCTLTGLVAYGLFGPTTPLLVRTLQIPFEFNVETIPDTEWDTAARDLGAAGWDIVTCRRASDGDKNYSYECIMKRPRRSL